MDASLLRGLASLVASAAIGITAVGQYSPRGDSPYGLLDMAGNVWEWTRSFHKDYPYVPEDGREDLEGAGPRVLRGGSWYYDLNFARCACRGRGSPGSRVSKIGFRVAASPGSP